MFKEFKEFAMRGNVVDMAVGIIIGAAFGSIVSSLVADVIMPPIGMLLGKVDFSNLFAVLKEGAAAGPYASLAAAKSAGAVTIELRTSLSTPSSISHRRPGGLFLVRGLNRLKRKNEAPAEVTTRSVRSAFRPFHSRPDLLSLHLPANRAAPEPSPGDGETGSTGGAAARSLRDPGRCTPAGGDSGQLMANKESLI